jgi:CubicO group peptidase (beta-lactamase class C family)
VAERGAGVVPPEFVDDLLHGGSRERWAAGDFADMFPDGSYRSYWYAPGIDPDVVCGIGIHGQMLYVDVARQVVVAVQSSWPMPDDEDWHLDNHALCRALAHAVA